MERSDKNKDMVNPNNFDRLLSVTGYLFPRNEDELEQFELLYKSYDFKLKDTRINPDEIISGSFQNKGRVIKMIEEQDKKDIEEIKIAARKGSEKISQSILEKMERKHNNKDEN